MRYYWPADGPGIIPLIWIFKYCATHNLDDILGFSCFLPKYTYLRKLCSYPGYPSNVYSLLDRTIGVISQFEDVYCLKFPEDRRKPNRIDVSGMRSRQRDMGG
jgi:hypothetical protein